MRFQHTFQKIRCSEAYLKPYKTITIEIFAQIANWILSLTILAKTLYHRYLTRSYKLRCKNFASK